LLFSLDVIGRSICVEGPIVIKYLVTLGKNYIRRLEKENAMRKKIVCLLSVLLVFMMMTGCSNEFAKSEYNDNDAITKSRDHFAKTNSVYNQIDGGCTLTVENFNGRETMLSPKFNQDGIALVEISLKMAKGHCKIVHIDGDGKVTKLMESTPDKAFCDTQTEEVSVTKGRNRIKIVGYDCEDVDLRIVIK
jgi:hypothetical protein